MNQEDIMKAWFTGFVFGTLIGIMIVSLVLVIFS